MKLSKEVLSTLANLGISGAGIPDLETNANEVMHTTNTGAGAELVPTAVLSQQIFDTIANYSSFLNMLPGYHGVGLNKIEEVSVIGDPGFFKLHAEKTTGALNLSQGNTVEPTAKVVLTQKQYDLTIDISNELSQFNILGAAGLEARLKEKIAKSMVRTVEGLIINGDVVTAATGNVNSDDAAPPATSYYLGADGLRKVGLTGTGTSLSVGTFDMADLIGVANLIGDYFARPDECLWIFNRSTYNTALNIAEFADFSKNGKQSTINTGAITNILGADLVVGRDMPKTEADGKVSALTPANNTLGQFLIFWKPAVQYGFGQELQLKIVDMGPDGFQLQGWFNCAVTIVQKKAGQVDSSVGVGYNVTLI